MTEDINPILTEDDFEIDYDADYYSLQLTKTHLTKLQAEKFKKQILQSLEEYPKLKLDYMELRNERANKVIYYTQLESKNKQLQKLENSFQNYVKSLELYLSKGIQGGQVMSTVWKREGMKIILDQLKKLLQESKL